MIFLKILLYTLLAVVSFFLLLLLTVIVTSLFIDTKKVYKKNSKYCRFLLNLSTGIALFLCRVKITVSGDEKIPNSRFVLVSNHRSNFDPIVTWYAFRKYNISFISKESNFRVPFFGKIIRKCLFLPIDRENIRNSVKTITQSVEYLKNDEVSIGIYPEGTRNRGEGLLPFHAMIFRIPQKAEVPLVVLSVRNTQNVKSNYPLKRTVVELEVVDVIQPDYSISHTTAEISDKVYGLLINKI